MSRYSTAGLEIHVHSRPEPRARAPLVKAVTWRIVGSLDTFVLSFVVPMLFGLHMSKSAKSPLSIASVETVTKIALFYFHERAWARVPLGRAPTSSCRTQPAATPRARGDLTRPPPGQDRGVRIEAAT